MKKLTLFILTLFICYFSYSQKIGIEIGNIAPEIKLPNPAGDSISLSSYRGQVVLIDFWAAWCGPCRKENPNVVEAYNKYKNNDFSIGKNFTIFGVSVDKDKEAWIKGINDDKLTWPNVSDLMHWNSQAVKTYGVRGIPSNFLIDKDGVIVAKNLRGPALEEALEKYTLKDPVDEFKKKLEELEYEYNRIESSDKYAGSKELQSIKKSMTELQELVKKLKK